MPELRLNASFHWTEQSSRLILTPSASAKSMFYYVQEIGHFFVLPRYFTEREHLHSFLVVYTLSGKGYLRYRGKQYTLEAGQVFFIDCLDYQYYETDKEDLWQFLWAHFNGGASRSYFEQFIKAGEPVVRLSYDCPLPSYMKLLLELQETKDARTELISSKIIVDMLTELLLCNITRERKMDTHFLPDYITRIIDYMEKHFSEKIKLDKLAAEFAISKYHLAREFKKFTGTTPNEYLINLRITSAKEMLRHSTEPVSQIAASLGFDNVSHFINVFKKHEELTPLNFRNKWNNLK